MAVERGRFEPPPYLVGAGLVYWGFLSNHPVIGCLLALIYEGRNHTRLRWNLGEKDFLNIWNIVMLVSLGVIVINLLRSGVNQTFRMGMMWAPALAYPIILAQGYSVKTTMPLDTVFIPMRRKRKNLEKEGRPLPPRPMVHMGYPYLAIALASTGVMMRQQLGLLFIVASVLCGMALFLNPSRTRARWWLSGGAFILAMALGIGSLLGIVQLQSLLTSFSFGRGQDNSLMNTEKGYTNIGDVNKIKASNKVVWRMRTIKGNAPEYLRDACFLFYNGGSWNSQRMSRGEGAPAFLNLYERSALLEGDDDSYLLHASSNQVANAEIELEGWTRQVREILPLPESATLLRDFTGEEIEQSILGSLRADNLNRLSTFRLEYRKDLLNEEPPIDGVDLFVNEDEQETLDAAAFGLWKEGAKDEEKLAGIESFFDKFEYSLDARISRRNSMHKFLHTVRKGHCEYFASATVLLLRRAGIPARYCTGYSVQEKARNGEYILRAKHRHAWAMAYIGGEWRYVDTTPPDWNEAEGGMGLLQPVKDFFNTIGMWFVRWQQSESGKNWLTIIVWSIISLVLIYALVRILMDKRKGHWLRRLEDPTETERLGSNSEFFKVIDRLSKERGPPDPARPLREWFEEAPLPSALDSTKLETCLQLHERLRFDPKGLSDQDRSLLQKETTALVEALSLPIPNGSNGKGA